MWLPEITEKFHGKERVITATAKGNLLCCRVRCWYLMGSQCIMLPTPLAYDQGSEFFAVIFYLKSWAGHGFCFKEKSIFFYP